MGILVFAVDWVGVSCIGFHNPYYALHTATMRALIEKAEGRILQYDFRSGLPT